MNHGRRVLMISGVLLCGALAARAQGSSPQRYAAAVAARADSAALLLSFLTEADFGKFGKAIGGADTLGLPYSLDSLMSVALDRRRAAKEQLDEFDAIVPPGNLSRAHEQVLTALTATMRSADSLALYAWNCKTLMQSSPGELARGNLMFCSVPFVLAGSRLLIGPSDYLAVRKRLAALLRDDGVELAASRVQPLIGHPQP